MTVTRKWVTARAAATLAQRDLSTIYEWIRQDRLATKRENGITLVLTTDVLELETRMNRRINNKKRD